MKVVNKNVETLLNKVVQCEEVTHARFEFDKMAEKGDGYCGFINFFKVLGDNKNLSVIVKTAPSNEDYRKEICVEQAYFHETYFYTIIYPTFCKFQFEKDIEKPFTSVAKCYATSTDRYSEGLVLENLIEQKYQLWDRRLPFNSDHMTLVLREYGRYHALSFALRDQQKQVYQDIVCRIDDIYEIYNKDPTNSVKYVMQMNKTAEILNNEADKTAYERLKKYIARHDFSQFLAKSMDEYTVIAHGDCWCNNVMFKYENHNNPKKPIQLKLLDFQVLRLVSPVLDLVHIFYTSGAKLMFDNYMDYMKIYYTSFSTYLKLLGSDPDELYPFEKFAEHWKTYCTHGLNMALFMIKIMLSENEEVPDFSNVAELGGTMMDAIDYEPKNSEFRKRVRDVVLHFVDNNFI